MKIYELNIRKDYFYYIEDKHIVCCPNSSIDNKIYLWILKDRDEFVLLPDSSYTYYREYVEMLSLRHNIKVKISKLLFVTEDIFIDPEEHYFLRIDL